MVKTISVDHAIHPTTALSRETARWPLSFQLRKPPPSGPLHEQSRSEQFWSHTLYRGPRDKGVRVFCSTTKQQSEHLAQIFLHETVLGFDGEWSEWYPTPTTPLKSVCSLVQIASEDKIVLFHIARHDGERPEDLIAPTLRKIIESPNIIKAGVHINGTDLSRLRQYFKLNPRGGFELSDLHKLITHSNSPYLVALKKQVQYHLGLPLAKGAVRRSDWREPLDAQQRLYAAADAYAGFMLYHCMNAKRVAMGLPLPISYTYDDRGIRVAPSEEHLEASDFASLDASSQRLFHLLASSRQKLASKANKPPYLVAQDATLRALAQARPTSYASLGQVKGIGPSKLSEYGAEWISIISHFVETDATGASQQDHTPLTEKVPSSLNSIGPRPTEPPNQGHKRAASASGQEVCTSPALLHTGVSFCMAEATLHHDELPRTGGAEDLDTSSSALGSSLLLPTTPEGHKRKRSADSVPSRSAASGAGRQEPAFKMSGHMRCTADCNIYSVQQVQDRIDPMDYVPSKDEEELWAKAFKEQC